MHIQIDAYFKEVERVIKQEEEEEGNDEVILDKEEERNKVFDCDLW